MTKLDKNAIKKISGTEIYERGIKCYRNNQVKHMDVNIENRTSDKIISIKAKVQSSNNTEQYDVYVKFISGTIYIDSDCDCNYWGRMCKHTVAVLVKFIQEENAITKDVEEKKNRVFMQQIKGSFLKNNFNAKAVYLNTSYKLDVSRGYTSYLALEIKVGETRPYVVKNVGEFIESIISKNQMYFGKAFTLNPIIHKFKDEDKKIIELLMQIYEDDMMLGQLDEYRNASSRLLKGKKAYLTESNAEKFFKEIGNRKIQVVINGNDFNDVSFVEEDLPLEFKFQVKNNKILLKQTSTIAIPITSKGRYFLYDSKIYKPSKEQVERYTPFFNHFMKENKMQLSFSENESEDIASFVIPSLKKISKNVKVDESFKNKFYEESLKSIVYFDKMDDEITASIIFKYGDIEINPLEDHSNREYNMVLVRDIEGEMKIGDILKSFYFQKEKSNYVLKDEEMLLDFMVKGMEILHSEAEVYYSESFKNIKVYNSSNYKSNIKLNNEDLLEFNFSIEDVDREELKNIFEALKQKKKYYRVKKGGFIPLVHSEIQHIGNMIDYLNIKSSDLEKENILIPKYNAAYIDASFKENNINFVERNKKFRELVNNIKDIGDIDHVLPENLNKIMRSYQKFGFKWFKTLASCAFGGILADEMGLGKTLQTIAFIKSEVDVNGHNTVPSLVVCPTSLVYNWEDEINKFQPDLKSLVISGSKDEREQQRSSIEKVDVVITSYALMRRDIDEYKDIKFRYCFLDEAQNIKNAQSLNAQSVKDIKANAYFALTGTPIENSLSELWSIFDFIMPGYLLTQRKFAQKYEIPIVKNGDKKALQELNRHIKPFILRRLKKDVAKELPPKIEHNMLIDMTEEQKKVYASFAQKAKEEMAQEISEKGFNKSKIKILALLTRLRQICCDPSTFIENYEGYSGKVEALLDIVENNINEGHKMLIFSQFTSALKNIAKEFEKRNINYSYLDGKTKAELRGNMVREFNEGDIPVFLISLKAGGTGLNLTSADIVIHFDPWWNPAVEEQASDRAHRIGQKNTVEVIRLIAKGSIEEKIYKIQEKKRKLIENVINENTEEEILLSNMSEKEIEGLFS